MDTPFNPLDLYPDYDPQQHIIIPMSSERYAIVDNVDADLAEFKWYPRFCSDGTCYARRSFNIDKKRHSQYLHRVILFRICQRDLGGDEFTDHINRNKLDNRRQNLRLANKSQNAQNTKTHSDNSSGYKGIYWKPVHRKWCATITLNYKRYFIGLFDTPELAYSAYCQAANNVYGEFAPDEIKATIRAMILAGVENE